VREASGPFLSLVGLRVRIDYRQDEPTPDDETGEIRPFSEGTVEAHDPVLLTVRFDDGTARRAEPDDVRVLDMAAYRVRVEAFVSPTVVMLGVAAPA
jgi:hypothetical protein